MSEGEPRRVLVVGNYSGRNAGDAALLEGLLRDVVRAYPEADLRFRVPTISPGFVRATYPENVEPVGLLPWHLSLKILGVPIVREVLRADLVLVTDAILFDRKLYNPLHNYLHTLSWVLPLGARRGVPVVLYAVSLGEIRTEAGERCLRRVLGAARSVLVRDRESAAMARSLAPEGVAPALVADCAFSSEPAAEARVEEICRRRGLFRSGRPVLAVNVNAYLDRYVGEPGERIGDAAFQAIVAGALDRAVERLGVDVLFVQTQVMDLPMAEGILRRVAERERFALVSNRDLGHDELAGLLGRAGALVGMRTHSLILAARVRTPLGGIVTYPKTAGFLASVGLGEERLEFDGFDQEALWRFLRSVWERRDAIRGRLEETVPEQERLARRAAEGLRPWLGPADAPVESARP